MSDQPQLFDDPPQPTWTRPKVRGGCGRDPDAGPGTCIYWWEGCPKGEVRGCYQHWRRAQKGAAQ